MDKILTDILQAKEDRGKLRKSIGTQGNASISLSFNIAGYPKSDNISIQAFSMVIDDLKIYLKANLISFLQDEEVNITDKAGSFFICPLGENKDIIKVKEITEKFESHHFLSRIIDVDIFSSNAIPISSHKTKGCLLCNDTAIACMRNKKHSHAELRKYIFSKLSLFIDERRKIRISNKVTEIINRSLLYEVSLSPKPGLVDFNSNGSHEDMNYYSFLNSTSALSPYWQEIISAAWNFDDNLSVALPCIRTIGLRAERAMFESTNGVNTQKGLIFLMAISAFGVTYLLKNNSILNNTTLQSCIKEICNSIVDNELSNSNNNNLSHGESTYKKHGIKGAGARYEAQQGFPVVFDHSLPYLESKSKDFSIKNKEQTDAILQNTLYLIIAKLNDSNILHRKGDIVANNLKAIANKVFIGEVKSKEAIKYCNKEGISPGGSADMLAISLFYYFIKQEII